MAVHYNPRYFSPEVSRGIPTDKAKYQNVRKIGDDYVRTINGTDFIIIFRENLDNFLADYWDKAENPGAYFGRDKLFDAIHRKYVGVSRTDVANFLRNNETSQVHQIAHAPKVNRPFSPKKPLGVWAVDLVFITNSDDEPIFTLFTCIDEFSKYLWARIVGDKTAAESAAALEQIFDEERKNKYSNLPSAIRSDNGGEFKAEFKRLLAEEDIKHIFTDTYNARMNAIVERVNGTLKRMINKWLTHSNGITIQRSDLEKLVSNYNNTIHGTTHHTPDQIHRGHVQTRVVRSAILARNKKLVEKNKQNYPEIHCGDFVRIHKSVEGDFRRKTKLKKYSYQKQWNYEIYRVITISGQKPGQAHHYELADEDGHTVDKKFIRGQLQKIDPTQLIKELAAGHYVPEEILDKRTVGRGRNRHVEYLLRWRGYDDPTWEIAQPGYQNLIDNYEQTK